MKKRLLLLFLIVSSMVNAQTALDRFAGQPNLRHAQIGIQIRELGANRVIAEHQAEQSLAPASVVKLLTTATTLETLGADFRLETRLETDGKVEQHTLKGNLYIRGSGDPTLGSEFAGNADFLAAWIDALKKQGITAIDGKIIADTERFDREPIPVRWTWEDIGNYYAGGVYAIAVFDNAYRLRLSSGAAGSQPRIAGTIPEVGYRFTNRLRAAANDKDSAYIYGSPYSSERTLVGTIPANRKEFQIKGDISNPPEFLVSFFEKELKKAGIAVKHNAYAVRKRETLYRQLSPPLADIVKETNFRSNNLYAEHLFKQLSFQRAQTANNPDALKVLLNHWQKRGLDTAGVFLYDGSGLSAQNALTADFLTRLLALMRTNQAFYASLPIAGREGTVASFLKNAPYTARLKSGSIDGVQAYAGYVSAGGKEYALAVLVNHFTGDRAALKQQIEELLNSYFCSNSK